MRNDRAASRSAVFTTPKLLLLESRFGQPGWVAKKVHGSSRLTSDTVRYHFLKDLGPSQLQSASEWPDRRGSDASNCGNILRQRYVLNFKSLGAGVTSRETSLASPCVVESASEVSSLRLD